jgi:DNA helicase II / ATP-dependent DNA helicase PcrA
MLVINKRLAPGVLPCCPLQIHDQQFTFFHYFSPPLTYHLLPPTIFPNFIAPNTLVAMIINEEVFKARYDKLNPNQKEAVDTIEGPVMVIAGPGTGKTEVLSMRIANLLRSDAQVKPYEILCLTFTDEATVAMRRRLLQVIGEDAHKVHIYTFHGFCNSIILKNPHYFGMKELMPISDLERMDLLYELIESLPSGHVLRRLKGDLFYDAKNLRELFDLMKSEHWSPDYVSGAIDIYIESLPEREQYIYKKANAKKNIKVGDPKEVDIKKETERMERTRAGALLFPEYQRRMNELGRYDFNDMILWVIKAFKERPEFLQLQQERFQYILVDEFQDTSGAQSELLTQLADYWHSPNLFIVGDDDQSIFEFQGARLQNIIDFYEKYKKDIRVIILKENYRSSQHILDRSTATIEYNKQRLIYQLQHLNLDKKIVASGERYKTEVTNPPAFVSYFNQLHEEAHIVSQIEEIQRSGLPLNNVAVLYAQHKQAENIITLLEKKKIPYWVKRPVNILELPMVRQLINVFTYLKKESATSFSGEELLFQLMHTSFFGITPIDVATLSIYLQQKDAKYKQWRYLIQDALLLETYGLNNPTPLHRLGQNLEKWIGEMNTLTLPMLMENILYDGGIISHILKSNNQVWEMQVLNAFFDFIKEECRKQPRLTVAGLLTMIERMEREKIPVPVLKVVRQENGVRFYTAFSAKGHEFEHVFLIGATKNYWEKKSGGNRGFSLPDTLTRNLPADEEDQNNEEVARRLFYVAMTRAKKHLHVSFAKKQNDEKELEASSFIDAICPVSDRVDHSLDHDSVVQHMASSMRPASGVQIELAKKELIEKRLEQFVLSVSAMNRYLDCPLSFYYEYILRVPTAKSDSMAFGSAVHFALEQLFKKMSAHPQKEFPSKDEMMQLFKWAMRRDEGAFTALQYDRRLELGQKILGEYYDQYVHTFNKVAITEYNINNAVANNVPIKGKLDKIEFDGANCIVIDYKTGSPEYSSRKDLLGPTETNPCGGDYWRQMVFYKILLESFGPAKGWHMTAGIFDFIEKNKAGEYVRYTVPITNDEVLWVKKQMKDVYDKIMGHEFDTGCGKEDCHWCNFATTYELARPVPQVETEEEII